MREIKFRAWRAGKMVNVDVLAISAVSWSSGEGIGVSVSFQPHIPVMQYTGLKDKNGKEIYEGDIVRGLTTKMRYQSQEMATWIIEFIFDASILCMNRLPRSKYPHADNSIFKPRATETVHVIGNIYENPELLL